MKKSINFYIYLILFILLLTPHLLRWKSLGKEYTALLLDGDGSDQRSTEETYAYATQINRIRYNQPVNDSYVLEYRRLPSPFLSEWLPSIVLGNIAKFIGLPATMVFLKVLGPLFLVFLFGKISQRAGYSSNLVFSAGIITIFIPKFFALLPYLSLFRYLSDVGLEFQRLFHPLFPWILMAMFIVFLQDILLAQLKFVKIIIAGLFLGLLFYTYIFAWTLVWLAVGILVVSVVLKKEYEFLKRLFIVISIGLAIGFPYFLNVVKSSEVILNQDFIAKTTMPIRQSYFLLTSRYILLLLFLIFLDRQWVNNIRRRILLILLGTSAILPDLSQLILGYNLEVDHWIERFIYPLSTLLFILGSGNWLSRHSKHGIKLFLGFLALLVFFRLSIVLKFELSRPVLAFQLGIERKALYEWMYENIPKNAVIGSLSFMEETYLAAYTPFYPYLPRGVRTLATTDEILSRYIFIANKFGVSSDYLQRTLGIPPEHIPLLVGIPVADQNAIEPLFGIRFLYDREEQYVQRLALREKAIKMLNNNPHQIGRLDYLLVGPTERFFANTDYNNCCQLIYENNEYKLYKYNLFKQ